MESNELLKAVYRHVASIKKPFDQRETIEDIRYLLNLIEDGCFTWVEIKEKLHVKHPWG